MITIDYKKERDSDTAAIKESLHPRKVVVAGPGTGKSYLFSKIIEQKRLEGKTNFLAITFIGKLGDELADDLCGLATTKTMHSFARSLVLEYCKGWNYYPRMSKLIAEDLKAESIESFEIGDKNYLQKTKYYKAVGDDDVVYYAVQICKKDESKIPVFDLVLIDEYQDFNAIESELVDLLAKKNEIVIVGDDDQSLYGEFRGSSPSFIREKYDSANTYFESHTLRFCSRCTQVIIKFFQNLVGKYELDNPAETDIKKKRIKKDFICYMPEGERDSKIYDSEVNRKIHLIKQCPVGMIAYKIQDELEKLVASQKVKEVLVIGEGQQCGALLRSTTQQLKSYGFKNIDYKDDSGVLPVRQDIVDAYKFLTKDNTSILGWRILGNPKGESEKKNHLKNARTLDILISGTPSELEKIKQESIILLEGEIESWDSAGEEAGEEMKKEDAETCLRHDKNEVVRRKLLIRELRQVNPKVHLPRPLCNIDITVCSILRSKGLGADVVFLIGFDQGKFPSKKKPTEGEIYQMLVATTRAKKRIYLINTIKSKVSVFADCLDVGDLDVEEIKIKS